jgi:hypothetical protein
MNDIDREWAYWQKFYDRERGLNVSDQPESSYFAFDVTDTELSNDRCPHEYGHHGIGVAEVLAIGFCLFVFSWLLLELVTA